VDFVFVVAISIAESDNVRLITYRKTAMSYWLEPVAKYRARCFATLTWDNYSSGLDIIYKPAFDTPRSKDTGILKDKLWGMNPPKV